MMAEEFRELPTPTYEYETTKLANYYEKAMRDIQRELGSLDLTNFERAQSTIILKNIADILKELDENASEWVDEYIPIAVEDGVIRALVSLGVAETAIEAKEIVKFNRLNRDFIKTAVADTQDDLLKISENVSRKVRTAVRQVTAEVMRTNLTKGINGTGALTSDVVRGLRKQLGDAVNTGIVDAGGRRWNPKTYAETVVTTKMSRSHTEAAINEAVNREAYYGVISRHGATDACRNWEGRIVKLVRDAPGDFPFIGDLPNREIFHPRCRHLVSPVRTLEYLPENIKRLNGIAA